MIFRSVRPDHRERSRDLPGDSFVPSARGVFTHAVTIQRPRREVWPWLAQMGAGRAGWYSYDRIDNGGKPSVDRIVPELQEIGVGDLFPALPGATEGFVVLAFEPERFVVLGWPSSEGPPVVSWAFVLEEPAPGITRLIVRARGSEGYEPPFGLPRWTETTLVRLGHFIMQRKQLVGIADRAEAGHHQRAS